MAHFVVRWALPVLAVAVVVSEAREDCFDCLQSLKRVCRRDFDDDKARLVVGRNSLKRRKSLLLKLLVRLIVIVYGNF